MSGHRQESGIQLQYDHLFSAEHVKFVFMISAQSACFQERTPTVSANAPKLDSVGHAENDLSLVLVFTCAIRILHRKDLLLDLIVLVQHVLSLGFKVVQLC